MSSPFDQKNAHIQFLKGSTCFPRSHCVESKFLTVCFIVCAGMIAGGGKSSYETQERGDDRIRTERLRRKAQGRSWFPQLVSCQFVLPNQSQILLKCREAISPRASNEGQLQPKSKGSSRSDDGRWDVLTKGSPRCLEAGTGPRRQIHREICHPG